MVYSTTMTMKRRRSCIIRNLPEEIISDIFSRLSIRELFQCQLVCKVWYKTWTKLVSDPFFVNLHDSRINHDQDGSNILIQCCTSGNLSKLCLVDHENHSSTTPKPTFDINLNLPSTKFMVVGSSNGLLCLCSIPDHETYYICNPLTKEVLRLPRACGLDMYREKDILCNPHPSGFAFDTTTNTYKVVRTWNFSDEIYGDKLQKTGVEIYTLGSGKWRRVEDFPTCLYNAAEVKQVFVNGALHWFISWCNEPESVALKGGVAAIDINCENFKIIEEPPRVRFFKNRTLGVLKESLCMIDDTYADEVIVWIVKDYGIKKLWTKEYIVVNEVLGPLQSMPFRILTTGKKQRVFLHGGEHQGFYDLEKKEFVNVLIDRKPGYFDETSTNNQRSSDEIDVVIHLGSLISPRTIDVASAERYTTTRRRLRPKRMVKKPSRFLT